MSAKEFFDTLESRVDASKTAGMNNSYLFDIEGEGQWKVDVHDGHVPRRTSTGSSPAS